MKKEIVLASKSKRRIELLKGLGMKFKVMPSRVEEEKKRGEDVKNTLFG
jgi:predicted house-cleaning NTP pyrophosphatase (Maf/HAM1 superfamily)